MLCAISFFPPSFGCDMEPDQITVYYNSACPVCDAGICQQRARMVGSRVEWVDVHNQPELASQLGIALEAMRERLHVRDAKGEIQVGDLALAELAARTRSQHLWAWVIRRFHFLTGPLYTLFARWLYRWNRRRGHW
jgi:predicted DCC family thiol-disulfide oxidoreductase YuxK